MKKNVENQLLILARRHDLDRDTQMELAESRSGYVRLVLARNLTTHRDVLAKLSKDKRSWRVREAVALNYGTSIEELMLLARDKQYEVRYAVSKNPNTPLDALMELANDKYWGIKNQVLIHPNCSLEIFAKLSSDKDWYLRYQIAKHERTPIEVVKRLFFDTRPEVREAAQKRL